MRHCEYWSIGRVLANRNEKGRFIEGHRHRSEKVKRKISKKNSGEGHPMFGKKFSKRRKERISNALKGRKMSKSWREKIGLSKRGKHMSLETEWKKGYHPSPNTEFKSENMKGKDNPFYGKQHSEESKKKMSESLKRRWKGIKEGIN